MPPGGKAFHTSVPVGHWLRRRSAGQFSRDGGSWAMGVLLIKGSGGAAAARTTLHLCTAQILAFPLKFTPSRYSFSSILIGHNFWVNLEEEN